MESPLTQALNVKTEPVAIVWADEKPDGAAEFAAGSWGCVMASEVRRPLPNVSAAVDCQSCHEIIKGGSHAGETGSG